MSSENTAFTPEFIEAIKKAGLYEKEDASKISNILKDRGLRKGKGYKAAQIRNFILHGHTCTLEVFQAVTEYYEAKREMKVSLINKQQAFMAQLNNVA